MTVNNSESYEFAYPTEALPGVFEAYCPDARLEVLAGHGALPGAVADYFEGQSHRFVHPDDYQAGNFESIYKIYRAGEAVTTFAARQLKVNSDFISRRDGTQPPHAEVQIYLYDEVDSQNAGHGEIRKVIRSSGPVTRQPFVGMTKTEDSYTNQGLGRRRLDVMNGLAWASFDRPIHSGARPMTFAPNIWKSLCRQGYAQIMSDETGAKRYVYSKADEKGWPLVVLTSKLGSSDGRITG